MASPVSRDPLSVPSPPHSAGGQQEAGTWQSHHHPGNWHLAKSSSVYQLQSTWVVSLAASSVVGDILASWLVLAQLLALAEGLDPRVVGYLAVTWQTGAHYLEQVGYVVPTWQTLAHYLAKLARWQLPGRLGYITWHSWLGGTYMADFGTLLDIVGQVEVTW